MALRTTVAGVQRMFGGVSVAASSKPLSIATLRSQSFLAPSAGYSRAIYSWQNALFSTGLRVDTTFKNFQTRTFTSKDEDPSSATESQHQEWVDFQKSIAVEGFETGQMTETKKKSVRGGRRLGRRLSKEQARLQARIEERQRMTDVGGGEYPPLRYSDEETERLLAEAYASIPKRAGKRGTRNLKRQKRRWWLVRRIRKKYKKQMAKFQERKMAERSQKIKTVKAVLEKSPEIRNKDREYQLKVLQRWTATMYPDKVAPTDKVAPKKMGDHIVTVPL